ncbi:DUF2623 family protein [Paraburkholderia sp. J8-2]|uniref:DUF2623 family protein n=1 Tax=Paraburkholderia sp. J8-2 TaxID=2805440 RepID=UPI002AB5FF5E|nr:DUF2623 family protein [Paraburkholderia sp. J8-2]
MGVQLICGRQTPFDLGFEHGAEAEEDPSALEFCSRVHEYQLGFIVGRSFSEAVKRASHAAAAATAGALGSRFGVKLDDVLEAMRMTDEHEHIIRQAYAHSDART